MERIHADPTHWERHHVKLGGREKVRNKLCRDLSRRMVSVRTVEKQDGKREA